MFTDYGYRREDGAVFAPRAFSLFVLAVAEHLEHVVVVGKLDPSSQEGRYRLDGVGFEELPYFELTRPLSVLRAAVPCTRRFWGVLSEVDGVWVLGPHPIAILFCALARLRGRRVTLGSRQDFPRYVRARHPRSRWMWPAADLLEAAWRVIAARSAIVAVGPQLAAAYPRARRLELSVSLVRQRDILPAAHPARDWESDELRLLSVGRLEAEKNPLLLADVLAELVRRDERWRLVVCGEGPLAGPLRERLARLGVAGRARLLGYVGNDRGLRELYRSSHALLHVSLTEGVPQVLFEAFAARLPVVATDVGGVRAACGDAALLIAPCDARAAADALVRLASDPALRGELAEAGARLVRAHTLESEAARTAAFLAGERWTVRRASGPRR